MKKRSVILAACIAFCIGLSSNVNAEELKWKPFVSEEGRFSVLMLGEPTYTETDEPTPVGSIRENLYSYEHGPISLDAEYSDLPFLAALFGSRSRIYNEIFKEFVKRKKATEISVDPFTFDAYRGKVLIYETSKRYGKLWMLLISRRIYILHASVLKDYPNKSLIDFYINSFKPIYRIAREHHKK